MLLVINELFIFFILFLVLNIYKDFIFSLDFFKRRFQDEELSVRMFFGEQGAEIILGSMLNEWESEVGKVEEIEMYVYEQGNWSLILLGGF